MTPKDKNKNTKTNEQNKTKAWVFGAKGTGTKDERADSARESGSDF